MQKWDFQGLSYSIGISSSMHTFRAFPYIELLLVFEANGADYHHLPLCPFNHLLYWPYCPYFQNKSDSWKSFGLLGFFWLFFFVIFLGYFCFVLVFFCFAFKIFPVGMGSRGKTNSWLSGLVLVGYCFDCFLFFSFKWDRKIGFQENHYLFFQLENDQALIFTFSP